MAHPYFRSGFYLGSLVFFLALASSMSDLTRAHAVFRECVAAIGDPNVLVTIFTSMVLSVIRISFILHVCRCQEPGGVEGDGFVGGRGEEREGHYTKAGRPEVDCTTQ